MKPIIRISIAFLLGLAALASIQASTDWSPVDIPAKGNLISAEFLDGRFFVVDESGAVFVSPDLVEWSIFFEKEGEPLQDIAYSDDGYVVVSLSGKVFSGSPGSWSESNAPAPFGLQDVEFGAGRFVAIGRGGVIVHSPDGRSWEVAQSVPENIADGLHRLVFAEDRFVAVGRTILDQKAGDRSTVVCSSNGLDWEVPEESVSVWLHDIVAADQVYVAVGGEGKIVRSRDGLNWEESPKRMGTDLTGVDYGKGIYLAVGPFGRILASTNGEDWQRSDLPDSTDVLSDVVFGADRFLAIGYRGVAHSLENISAFRKDLASSTGSPKPYRPPGILTFGFPEDDAKVVSMNRRPTYSFLDSDGAEADGFSTEVWEGIARLMGIHFVYAPQDSPVDVVEELITHRADFGLGGLSITPGLSDLVEVSDPTQLIAYRTLIRSEEPGSRGILHLLRTLFTRDFFSLFFWFGAAVLVVGIVMHFLERKINPQAFPDDFRLSLFWSAQTLIAHNCGSRVPGRWGTSAFTIFWMTLGVIFTAQVTAVLTSNLTTEKLENQPIRGPGDFHGRMLGTIEGSAAESWIERNLFTAASFADLPKGVTALKSGEIDALVYDSLPLKQFVLHTLDSGVELVGPAFGTHGHTVLMRPQSTKKDEVNRSLRELFEAGYIDFLNHKWFGVTFGDRYWE